MLPEVRLEVGVDISKRKSKSLSEIPIGEIDIVVILSGDSAENCPIFSGKGKKIHWALRDLAKAQGSEEEVTKVFRKVRDKIKLCIEKLDSFLFFAL